MPHVGAKVRRIVWNDAHTGLSRLMVTVTETAVAPRERESQSVRIEPPARWPVFNLKELWEYRELISLLVVRDLKASYAQTLLGASWVIVKPVLLMLVFTFVFALLVKVPSGDVPYPIFCFAGLLPWQYFARSLSGASTSLMANQHLITKVYFPRLILPLSALVTPALEFIVSSVVLMGMMWVYQVIPPWRFWLVPVFVLLAAGTALGGGIWLSALNVRFRDIAQAHMFITQLWFFATPVVYPAVLVPAEWQWLYWLNPMVAVVEGVRWALLGSDGISGASLLASVGIVAALIVSGLFCFLRMDRTLADTV